MGFSRENGISREDVEIALKEAGGDVGIAAEQLEKREDTRWLAFCLTLVENRKNVVEVDTIAPNSSTHSSNIHIFPISCWAMKFLA